MAVWSSKMLPSEDDKICRILSSISLRVRLFSAPAKMSLFFCSSRSGRSFSTTIPSSCGKVGGANDQTRGLKQIFLLRQYGPTTTLCLRTIFLLYGGFSLSKFDRVLHSGRHSLLPRIGTWISMTGCTISSRQLSSCMVFLFLYSGLQKAQREIIVLRPF